MTYWAQVLHFYQPPTQTHEILERVTRESYRPLVAVLKEHPAAAVAINMNGVLCELLREHGMGDVVDGLRELAERGQVEFLGSGRFHPILPLIPDSLRRQAIEENARANRPLWPAGRQPRGFFPPELCYSNEIVPALAATGHEWLLLSGVACSAPWPSDVVYRVPSDGRPLAVLFRDDIRSNRISFRETDPEQFVDDLERASHGAEQGYVLTAMDAETYGHHIPGWERDFLARTYSLIESHRQRRTRRVEMILPSEVVDRFPAGPVIEPHPSSWSTTLDDIAALNPYPLWNAPGNRIHELQWEITDHCIHAVAVAARYAAGNATAQRYAELASTTLQPALHSCQYWWASRRPMWDVRMISLGLSLQAQVLLYAMHAIEAGSASEPVRREMRWRHAGAEDARRELEGLLIRSEA